MTTRFTQADLDRMGLKANPDGTLSKPKTVPQPRDIIAKVPVGIDRVKYEMSLISKGGPSHIHTEEGFISKKKRKGLTSLVYFNGMDIQDVYAKCHNEGTIFIHGNIPSSKNLLQPIGNRLIPHKRVGVYKKASDIHWRVFGSKFKELLQGKIKPYRVEFTFIRDSRRKCDFHNLVQLPMDMMTQYGWIDDDNMDEVVPVPGNPSYGYDPKMAGVIIKVL